MIKKHNGKDSSDADTVRFVKHLTIDEFMEWVDLVFSELQDRIVERVADEIERRHRRNYRALFGKDAR